MEKKPIVLVVDDVASNIQTIATILKEDYQIKVATDGVRALELSIQEPTPDLILLDVVMPDMDGYDVLVKLKENENTEDIPVIFITGNDTTDDEEKGLVAGAVDYITKPVRPAILKARINTHLTIKYQRDELLYIALHDKLTGLHNRHYLTEIGDQKFARAKRHNEDLSVVMCDVDHFKSVNDTYGHLGGDKVLKAMGSILDNKNRAEDFSARYGGEEFVILLEHCTSDSAKEKAENIRLSISELDIDGISVTASFGVVQLNNKHESFEALLKDADEALYKAKESGRNRVVVFD